MHYQPYPYHVDVCKRWDVVRERCRVREVLLATAQYRADVLRQLIDLMNGRKGGRGGEGRGS